MKLWHFVEQTSECTCICMYIYACVYIYSLQIEHFSITDFFSYCHKQQCIIGTVDSSQLHNPAHMYCEPRINNTSYYNTCHLSCSLFTFPFFNCMLSFFQLCIIDLRRRLQRKESLQLIYYITLTQPIVTKKTKNENFFSMFLPSSLAVYSPYLSHIHFKTPEFAFKSYLPPKGCLKVSTKIKLIVRLYGALEKVPV